MFPAAQLLVADEGKIVLERTAGDCALETLFVGAWAHAAPIGGRSRPREGAPVDLARAVLTQLCAGNTDSHAARRLGISLRTYRRRVASIMRELGAESRFQAGALAVEAGLLPASA